MTLLVTSMLALCLLAAVSSAIGCGATGAADLPERSGVIKAQGKPLTLIGNELKVGQKAPAFSAADTSMKMRGLEEWAGKVVVISSVPSLDTGVCDRQTRRFNQEAGKLGPGVAILTISLDLPFAQKRWCGAAGVEALTTLSDYRERAFSVAYGLLIKETKLIARSVIIIDRQGVVRYIQIVDELSHEPDYDAALAAVKKVAG
jgi:thioredoxin-dependent peroxiredoxin